MSFTRRFGAVLAVLVALTAFPAGAGDPDTTELYGEEWIAEYSTAGTTLAQVRAMQVSEDSDGRAYVHVAGTTAYGDALLLTYDSAGSLLWSATHNGPGAQSDEFRDVTVDRNGCVYVTGYEYVAPWNWDVVTVKYGPDGTRLWTARYDGPVSGSDQGDAVAVDTAGNVYVACASTGTTGTFNAAVIKYDANGSRLWVTRWNGAKSAGLSDLVVDSAGDVYVAGTGVRFPAGTYSFGLKLSGVNGALLWTHLPAGYGYAFELALDSAQSAVYVAGIAYPDAALFKIDAATGTELWRATVDGGEFYDLALDSDGDVHVAGYSGGDALTARVGPDGRILWTRTWDGPAGRFEFVTDLAVDGEGNTFITGLTSEGPRRDYATLKYGPDGEQLWVGIYSGGVQNVARGLGLDGEGNVYVTGDGNNITGLPIVTIKYQGPQTGAEALGTLISLLSDLGLDQGTEASLSAKLENAAASLESGSAAQREDAVGKLEAFINECEAQSGTKLTVEQAEWLIGRALAIIAWIEQ